MKVSWFSNIYDVVLKHNGLLKTSYEMVGRKYWLLSNNNMCSSMFLLVFWWSLVEVRSKFVDCLYLKLIAFASFFVEIYLLRWHKTVDFCCGRN